jgi:hypothetical protein
MHGFVRKLAGTVLACAVVGALPASAREATRLKPVTPWNVDYSEKSCILRRGFADAADPDILNIEQFGPSNSFQLLLFSNELRRYEQGSSIWLRLGADERSHMIGVMPGQTKDKKAFLSITRTSLAFNWAQVKEPAEEESFAPVTPAREAAITSIGVEFAGRAVIFETGPLHKPFEALRKCTDNLVKSWGLDPVQQARLRTHPEPLSSPGGWITSASYPAGMLMSGKQAIVNFRLNVDDKGLPTACEVQRSYADPTFDKVTCTLIMRRARFSPALDANGKAVPSYYLNTVRFTMK